MVFPIRADPSSDSISLGGAKTPVQTNRSAFVKVEKYGFYHSVSPSTQKLAQQAQKALKRNRKLVQASKKKQGSSRRGKRRDFSGEGQVRDEDEVAYDSEDGGRTSETISSASYLCSGSGSYDVSSSDGSSFISASGSLDSAGSRDSVGKTHQSSSASGKNENVSSKFDESAGTASTSPSTSKRGDRHNIDTRDGNVESEPQRLATYDRYEPNEECRLEGDEGQRNEEDVTSNSNVGSTAKNHLSDLEALPVMISSSSSSDCSDAPDDGDGSNDRAVYPESILRFMKPPPKQLMDLLIVARNEPAGARRSNACGALKTLASSQKNRVRMAWTKGVIISLAHILNDDEASQTEIQRTLSTLLYLCIPEKNWLIIYQSPGLVGGLLRSVKSRHPPSRHTACLCLEQLTKNKANRKTMAHSEEVLEALSKVIVEGMLEDGSEPSCVATTTLVEDTKERSEWNEKNNAAVVRNVVSSTVRTVLTVFLGLSNLKDVSYILARTQCVVSSLVEASGSLEAASNLFCVMILTNLSRHPENALHLVFQVKGLVKALVDATKSEDDAIRKYGCYGLQNLSCDSGCRQEMGNAPELLGTLSKCTGSHGHSGERIAACTALRNLSKEASNVVNFTNTEGCTKNLILLAQDDDEIMIQYLACDTLATLSHWIQRCVKAGLEIEPGATKECVFPSCRVCTWEQWQ